MQRLVRWHLAPVLIFSFTDYGVSPYLRPQELNDGPRSKPTRRGDILSVWAAGRDHDFLCQVYRIHNGYLPDPIPTSRTTTYTLGDPLIAVSVIEGTLIVL